jgi:predicted nuclease with TOPRIM domain
VKRKVSDDPRYDAVGSSSLREELFNTFVKASTSSSNTVPTASETKETHQNPGPLEEGVQERLRLERKSKAVKDREEKVKAERDRLEVDIGRSRMGLNRDEGEREFRCAHLHVLVVLICCVALIYLSFTGLEIC